MQTSCRGAIGGSGLRVTGALARLFTCAVSVILPFWEAQAFTWDHRYDDDTSLARTANSLKLLWVTTVHSSGYNSRQAHYTTLALFTWNLDRATKATVSVWLFFLHGASRPKCGGRKASDFVVISYIRWNLGGCCSTTGFSGKKMGENVPCFTNFLPKTYPEVRPVSGQPGDWRDWTWHRGLWSIPEWGGLPLRCLDAQGNPRAPPALCALLCRSETKKLNTHSDAMWVIHGFV